MMDPMKAAVATSMKRKRMSQVGKGKKAMPMQSGDMPAAMGAAMDAKRSGPGSAVRNAVIGKAARLARKK